jgi:16S rRNA (cytosine1402-N4)-methyltransferase
MLKKIINLLNIKKGNIVIDCTTGFGGHLEEISTKVGAKGKIIGFDKDLKAHDKIASGGVRIKYKNIILINSSFSNIKKELYERNINKAHSIFCDLGLSSMQVDFPFRGFSFRHDGPLDMRMIQSQKLTACDILNKYSKKNLKKTTFNLGKEFNEGKVIKVIKRKILPNSTFFLKKFMIKLCDKNKRKKHPARKIFQKLRILVNDELLELQLLLNQLSSITRAGSRVVIISFHSLEDKVIKNFFGNKEKKIWRLINRKPIKPNIFEIFLNKRTRSGKIRCIERL